MSESARFLVERLEQHVDAMEGLITLRAFDEKVLAVVEDTSVASEVRASLIERGVAGEILEVVVVTDFLIPYPTDDERLTAWIERSGSS